jgi:CheY-like chemotaxis protein
MTSARVLIVEDNPLNLKLVRDVLLTAGFGVIEARTGEEGVARAQDSHPDVILMDLQLPGINGTQALRLIRNRRPGRRPDCFRDGGGSRPRPARRLRRLPQQADQRS